ncbi:MAG TPA: DMT family transporter, partial [Anaerolineae bacterium]
MKLKEWGTFALLGLIWGSSFLWIKIAVEDIHPFVLVAFRVLLGLIGLIVGFIGVIVLVARDFKPGGLQGSALGQLAVLLAAISYATALTFSRRYLRGTKPVVQSTMILIVASAVMGVVTPVVERPIQLPTLPITWLALLWLGVMGLCVAYLLFFYLNNVWGPTRASLVTYVFPVVGVFLGIIFLNEIPDWNMLIGSAL